jgi:mannose-6-phosphate isomerase-like protein (cupin superfamily)
MKEDIVIDGQLCAIILYASYDQPGIQFFTPNEFSQQLASMSYAPGKVIPAHTHNPVQRKVFLTQETLFIRKGKVRVDFFTQQQEYHESRVLGAGDVLLLISGGHGFEVLEELNMIEAKQGPYAGDMDKTRFSAKLPSKLKFGSPKVAVTVPEQTLKYGGQNLEKRARPEEHTCVRGRGSRKTRAKVSAE